MQLQLETNSTSTAIAELAELAELELLLEDLGELDTLAYPARGGVSCVTRRFGRRMKLHKNPLQTPLGALLASGHGVDENVELGDRLAGELDEDDAVRLINALYDVVDGIQEHYRIPPSLPPAGDNVAEERTHNAVTYRCEYQRCGKPNCRCVHEGPVHGPYWRAYTRDRGRLRSHYIGKTFRELD